MKKHYFYIFIGIMLISLTHTYSYRIGTVKIPTHTRVDGVVVTEHYRSRPNAYINDNLKPIKAIKLIQKTPQKISKESRFYTPRFSSLIEKVHTTKLPFIK